MFVSVIIPTKNEEANIGRLLKQLRKQSFKDFEIIVADAKSADRTREIARSLGAIIVDGGLVGAGRNLGAAVAKGDIFIFMDADAVITSKHFLRDVLKEMRRKQLDIAGLMVKPYNGTFLERLTYRFYNKYTLITGKRIPHAVGVCMIAKRFVHEAIGGFDEAVTLAEDMHYARLGSDVGEFGILKSHVIETPMRRWRTDGWFSLVWKYLYTELHMLFKGPVKHDVGYEFDHFEETQTDA